MRRNDEISASAFDRVEGDLGFEIREYLLLAVQSERDGGAWRWTVGHFYTYDGYGYWNVDTSGLAATEARAQAQAREAVKTVIAPKMPWTCPDWAVIR